jgi:hypothetical protein
VATSPEAGGENVTFPGASRIGIICLYALCIVLCLFVLLVVLFASLVIYEVFSGHFGAVQWKGGGAPDKITVVVHSSNGAPRNGVEVISTSYSGTSHPEYTNSSGIATITPGEDEVLALKVDGITVMNKDNPVEEWFAPKLGREGLLFNVRLDK